MPVCVSSTHCLLDLSAKCSFFALAFTLAAVGVAALSFDLSAFKVNCTTAAFNVSLVHYEYTTSIAIGIVLVNVVFDSHIFRSMHKSIYKRGLYIFIYTYLFLAQLFIPTMSSKFEPLSKCFFISIL